ncbi:hypothetical protein [Oscillibacter sp. ER4]|uniref:hypothetical protein n=1 Tax=Oscillibacter sp. ER4 TaxID=1519439 RepID=UPI00051B3F54|nr:hypothetical protein [Oscillibacter sp. ER4]
MAEYIPRSEAIAELRHRCYPCGEGIEAINGIPAADVAPVTRCKDCANSYEDAFGRVCAYGICVDCTVPDDFYCASSKPKEDTC